jgi:hypothetical protein
LEALTRKLRKGELSPVASRESGQINTFRVKQFRESATGKALQGKRYRESATGKALKLGQ